MIPIFRLQLREMVGGRKLWLVAFLLGIPLLLALAAMQVGGLGRVKQRLDEAEAARKDPRSLHEGRQILSSPDGELELLDGLIVLTEDGLTIHYEAQEEDERGEDSRDGRRRQRPRRRDRDYDFGPLGSRWIVDFQNGWLRYAGGLLSIDPDQEIPKKDPNAIANMNAQDDLNWPFIAGTFLFAIYCQAIAVLMALLYAAPLLNTELEAKTLPYLLTRPVPRWQIIVGKYLAIATVLLPFHLASLTGAWFLLEMPGGTDLLGAELAGSVAAVLAYNALFILIGYLIPSRAMVVAVIYIILEAFLSFIPALINRFTITYYIRSIAIGLSDVVDMTDLPEEAEIIIGNASLGSSFLIVGVIIALGLGFASLLAAQREYVVTEKA